MKNKEIPQKHTQKLELLSAYLRELRFSEGMTQKEFGQYLNIHYRTLQRAENSKNITLLTVFEIADAFDINPKQLFDLE